ncbi:hypothetical protein PENTCL1PPCAC_1137, partial [Pristionchus entomophagus]
DMASPLEEVYKDSPGMPQLKHLLLTDEDPVAATSGPDELNPDDPESFFNEEIPLEPSALGDAVDSLLLNWSQIISNTCTKYPGMPPSIDHVKEVAAIVVQGFCDACADLNAEFAKVAVEWVLENGEAAEDERVAALKGSISRQVTLLARAQATLDLRTEDYFCSSIDDSAGSAAAAATAAAAASRAASTQRVE